MHKLLIYNKNMDNEILKVFNDGKNPELPLEDIRGGWCISNTTCGDGSSTKCNVNRCSPDEVVQDPLE